MVDCRFGVGEDNPGPVDAVRVGMRDCRLDTADSSGWLLWDGNRPGVAPSSKGFGSSDGRGILGNIPALRNSLPKGVSSVPICNTLQSSPVRLARVSSYDCRKLPKKVRAQISEKCLDVLFLVAHSTRDDNQPRQ